jgi:hypothetical protein
MIDKLISESEFRDMLIKLFVTIALDGVDRDTPMPVVRERCRIAGQAYGRSLSVCVNGEVSTAILMEIRASEEVGRERFERISGQLYGPGGEVRNIMNKEDAM